MDFITEERSKLVDEAIGIRIQTPDLHLYYSERIVTVITQILFDTTEKAPFCRLYSTLKIYHLSEQYNPFD